MSATPRLILIPKHHWIDHLLGIACLLIIFTFCLLTGFGFASISYLLLQPEKTAPSQVATYMELKLQALRENCTVVDENISHTPNPRGDDITRQAVRFQCPTTHPDIPYEMVFWSSLKRQQGDAGNAVQISPSL